MIKTTLVYDEQTLTDFFTFHLKRKDKIRWLYYAIALLFFIFGIIVTVFLKKVFFGLVVFVLSTIMFMIFPSQAKRAAKKTANSRFKRDPQSIIFYEDKIEQHLEKKILLYKWDLVKEVHETSKYIYFYISKTGALIVCKDTITNDEHNQLIELVKKHNKAYFVYKHQK